MTNKYIREDQINTLNRLMQIYDIAKPDGTLFMIGEVIQKLRDEIALNIGYQVINEVLDDPT